MAPFWRPRVAALLVVFMLVLGLVGASPSLGQTTVGYVSDQVLVKFLPGTPASSVARAHANIHAQILETLPEIDVQVMHLPPQVTVARALGLYAHNPNVYFVEPVSIVAPEAVPNDPYYPNQWHLPKIAGPTAWDTTTGSANVIVAILDTGVDGTHPDLVSKLVPGWNTYDNNSNTADVYGHGTSTAGSAAACGGNGLGVASVAWNCLVMPVRISDPNGYGYDDTVANGLIWAANHGARVANISYSFSDSYTVSEAAKYFRSKGGVVTVSAGNNNTLLTLPDNPYLITVGATDSSDRRASFSNYGNVIDVVAPGSGIYTTARGGGYRSASGTSFSAPITAGVAALVISANPGLTAAQVENCIFAGADDLGTAGWDQTYGYGRVNAAKAVALAVQGPSDTQAPSVSFSAPEAGATVSDVVSVQVNATDNVGVTSVALSIDGGVSLTDTTAPFTFSWDTLKASNGTHTLTATATDSSGNTEVAEITVTVLNTTTETIDTTPPSVSITSPTNGVTVTTVITVQVSASDDVALARIELYLDSVCVGSSTNAITRFRFNTKKWSNGTHVLQALAYDAAGNYAWSNTVMVDK